MTPYFKFLEWWLLPCEPYKEGMIPLSPTTVALENSLVENVWKKYGQRKVSNAWQYHYQWA